jgi:hypothetical protein
MLLEQQMEVQDIVASGRVGEKEDANMSPRYTASLTAMLLASVSLASAYAADMKLTSASVTYHFGRKPP